MQRFKNILYYADGGDPDRRTLERALALATANEARLTVMDVLPEARLAASVTVHFSIDLDDLVRQRRHEELEAMVAPYAGEDSIVYCHVRSGTGFIEIVRAVQENGYDLVIKRARGASGLRERLFGSTDMHLLRKCPCPVWIEHPDATLPYRTVLAAVDPMAPNEAAMNVRILELAQSLAAREDAALHVVHAWWLEWEATLRNSRGAIPEPELKRLLDAEEEEHRQRLDALLAPFGLDSGQRSVHLIKQRPAPAIAGMTEVLGADVIVMGTVGRSGVPGLIIGNTAEDVLQSTRVSVLTVKPAGFQSPVPAP